MNKKKRTSMTQEQQISETALLETDTAETSENGAKPEPVVNYQEFETSDLLRAHIFNVSDILEEVVNVPEWGVRILVKALTARERARILKSSGTAIPGQTDMEKLYPDMVIASCYHAASHKPVFKPSDRDALNGKMSGIVERLAMVCIRLSGLDKASQEQIRKN
jgi:hypothetical protein